jgi:hypothetical protein
VERARPIAGPESAGDADGWAEVSRRFRHEAASAADFPAVGDWVGVDGRIIRVRLERRGTVSRAAGAAPSTNRSSRQTWT